LTSLSVSSKKEDLQPVEEFSFFQIKTQCLSREYHWGLEPGELDLDSPLNHVSVRGDIARLLSAKVLVLIPSEETVNSMSELAEHNQHCSIAERWRCFDFLPIQPYQYRLVPNSRKKHEEIPLFAFDPQTFNFEQFSYPYDNLPTFTLDLYPFHSVMHSWSALCIPDNRSSPFFTIFRLSFNWALGKPSSFGRIPAESDAAESDSESCCSMVSTHSDVSALVESPPSHVHVSLTKRTANRISSWLVTLQEEKPLPVVPFASSEQDDESSSSDSLSQVEVES